MRKPLAVITIDDQFVTITYSTPAGTVGESYQLDADGVLQPISGNFEDERIFGDNDNLVNALTNLAEPAAAVCRALAGGV